MRENIPTPELPCKPCKKCGKTKLLTCFYPCKILRDGRRNECRVCAALAQRISRAENPVREAEYRRRNYDSKRKTAQTKKHRAQFPEKTAAHNAVARGIMTGRIVVQPCENCESTTNVHGHHDDYSKRLDIRWLCHTHHMELHRNEREVND